MLLRSIDAREAYNIAGENMRYGDATPAEEAQNGYDEARYVIGVILPHTRKRTRTEKEL